MTRRMMMLMTAGAIALGIVGLAGFASSDAVIAVAFILAVAILTWGPWNTPHVAPNPGPSGTPGATVLDETPPPAAGPSDTTTRAAR